MTLTESTSFQKTTAKLLTDLIEKNMLPPKIVLLVLPVARKLVEAKDQGTCFFFKKINIHFTDAFLLFNLTNHYFFVHLIDVTIAWTDTFVACIKHVPVDSISQQVIFF